MIKVTVQKFYRINGASTQKKGVESDIVLPMSTAALQLGEAELDYVMPYDEIPAAAGYVKDGRIARILPELSRRSAARVAADKDLQDAKWNIDYRRRITEENKDSLNKATRAAENEELVNRQKAITADRKVRYAAMAEQDASKLCVRRLKLDDVKLDELPVITKNDDEKYMDEVKDPEEELEEEVEYPFTLDPILRESLNIVNDMLELP